MKTALITGASSGIGTEFAIIHAQKGGNLVLVARSLDKLEKLKKELEDKYKVSIYLIKKDLYSESAAKEIFEEIQSQNIQIDYLINNAGHGGGGAFGDRSIEDELNMINLNIISLVKLTHLYLAEFKKRGSGKILNVASSAALTPGGPYQSVYFATKAFVLSFTNGLALELEGTGITATSLCPGATKTGFAKSAGMKDSKLFIGIKFEASEAAKDGYNAMMKGKLVQLTTLTLVQKINLFLAPIMPRQIVLNMIKDLQR